MLLQQQIASSSPSYELLKFTSVHCLIQSLLQWSPIAILFVAYLHRVGNWRGILQQQQEVMQILQNQAFFFEKGRQDILPHCNDISDNEAQLQWKHMNATSST